MAGWACMVGGMHCRGHAWQGVCIAGGMHGGGAGGIHGRVGCACRRDGH